MGIANAGRDLVAKAVGGDTVGFTGTNSATTATTLTGTGFPAATSGPPDTGGLVGHSVVCTAPGGTYGTVITNSTTVLTVDQWHSPTAPETVATTPTSTSAVYVVMPGGFPAFYMGISIATRVFTAADNFLTDDGSTVSELWFSGGGMRRRLATWAHTTGQATYTLANTFTGNGSDTYPRTIAKIGIFQHFVNTTVTTSNTGQILFQTLLSATATLSASGDNVAITDTVTIS